MVGRYSPGEIQTCRAGSPQCPRGAGVCPSPQETAALPPRASLTPARQPRSLGQPTPASAETSCTEFVPAATPRQIAEGARSRSTRTVLPPDRLDHSPLPPYLPLPSSTLSECARPWFC